MDEYVVDVDREMQLTVDVIEPGRVRLHLPNKLKRELRPGDTLVLALKPVEPDKNRPTQPTAQNWLTGSDDTGWDIDGGAGAAHPSLHRGTGNV